MFSRWSRITGSETSNLVDWLPGSTQAGSGFLRDGYYYMYNGGVGSTGAEEEEGKKERTKNQALEANNTASNQETCWWTERFRLGAPRDDEGGWRD